MRRSILAATAACLLFSSQGYSDDAEQERKALRAEIEDLRKSIGANAGNHTTFGGYGEIHYNESEKTGGDYIDLHRVVFFMAHSFSDWITLHSELEVEHAFAATDRGGEILFEQLHMDFDLSEKFGLRIGRILAPLGIINKTHEPTTFNGVERPSFAKYLLPSTWSLDGIGIYGTPVANFRYELYVTNGLNGAGLSGKSGLRGARLHERPSWNHRAITGRMDYSFANSSRIGLSYFSSGVDNGNKGNNPGFSEDVKVTITSADFQTSYSIVDFRAVMANVAVDNVKEVNDFLTAAATTADDGSSADTVGASMVGNSAELAVHILPESLCKGKLVDADLVVFARADAYNTHASMADGDTAVKAYDKSITTIGMTFKPVETVALKFDQQTTTTGAGGDATKAFNAGLGWHF